MSNDALLTRNHPSSFQNQRYVYPVLSRRAGGISIGINLSPSGLCNYRCVYCQASSQQARNLSHVKDLVDPEIVSRELQHTATMVLDGSLFHGEWFAQVQPEHRILCDFALSGDGEPTLSPVFEPVVDHMIAIRNKLKLDSLKLVLITNATQLTSSSLDPALTKLINNHGEIWAKLDAGTSEYYGRINRSAVPFDTILRGIISAAEKYSVTIQTMLLKWNGQVMNDAEIMAYCKRLNEIREKGVINRVQLYTVARSPMESEATAVSVDEMVRVANFVFENTGIKPELFAA